MAKVAAFVGKVVVPLLLTASAALMSPGAQAAPYSISHTGTLNVSTIPGINSGQTYTLTLVFDNGGSTAVSQNWTGANLRCAIWTFNTGGTVVYTQNLVANPPLTSNGTVTTNGAGVLTTNFTAVNDTAINAGYTVTGTALVNNVSWFANGINSIFYDTNNARSVGDVSGGVQMAPAGWSNPVGFTGNCAGLVLGGSAVSPVNVPTLSEWTLFLLSGLAGLSGFAVLRRKT